MKTRGKVLLKIGFSVLFFVILLSFVQGNEMLTVLKQINWGYFTLSLLVAPAVVFVSCLKWRVILVHGQKQVSMIRLLQIYCIGYFFSNILPSTVGGDVVRAYYGGNEINDQVYSAISVFIERFSGIVFLLLLVLLMPLLQPVLYLEPPVFISAVGGVVGLSVIGVLVLVPTIATHIANGGSWLATQVIRWLGRLNIIRAKGVAGRLEQIITLIAGKAEKVAQRLKKAWRTMSKDKTFLIKIALLTLVFYILAILNVYLSFKAFGVHVAFITVCMLVPAALFFAHLPVTVLGNLGYFESVFVIFFMIAGVPPAESLVMGLLLRVKLFMVGIVGMIVYFTFDGRGTERTAILQNLIKEA